MAGVWQVGEERQVASLYGINRQAAVTAGVHGRKVRRNVTRWNRCRGNFVACEQVGGVGRVSVVQQCGTRKVGANQGNSVVRKRAAAQQHQPATNPSTTQVHRSKRATTSTRRSAGGGNAKAVN